MSLVSTIVGFVTGNGAEVDANNNLKVNTPTTTTQAGFVSAQAEIDSGSRVGSRRLRQLLMNTVFRRLSTGTDTVVWYDTFAATAQNTAIWKAATTTFTFTQSGGFLNFNTGAVTTSAAAQLYQTYRYFALESASGLTVTMTVNLPTACPANAQFNFGLFNANTASTPFTPSDGVYFRINSTGLFGVLNYAGVETLTGTLVAGASITTATAISYRIVVTNEVTEFWWVDPSTSQLVLLGTLATPAGNGQPGSSSAFPLGIHLTFSGVAGSAWQPKVANTEVLALDVTQGLSQAAQNAEMGMMGAQGQNGMTVGSTALYTNSLAPGAGAAATNTTAALGSGLGGQFTLLPTLTANTDGIISSFQNPAGTTAIPGRNLVITGVSIQGLVTTIFTGGPVYGAWSLAFGHTAVSLATGETALAKAPRRIPLGYDSFVVTAPVGTLGAVVSKTFNSPIVISPGEFVQTVMKNMGTVTTLGAIVYQVTFDAYWD